jgi:UDP-4-amino-4,6-dideoxy-N-acetyl-beta-L-altrosamine N-acetyltransferase
MNHFLRELSRSDISELNKWRNERDVQKWLVSPFRFVAEEIDERWFDSYLNGRANSIRLAICESEQGSVVGAVYLLSIDWVARSGEFGIWIGDKASQGKGVGEFATRSILNHAFSDLNLHRVQLTVLPHNEHAIGLYKKVGFIEEGRARQAIFKDGKYIDLIQMAILSGEYRHIHP